MSKKKRKLELNREVMRRLTPEALARAAGGDIIVVSNLKNCVVTLPVTQVGRNCLGTDFTGMICRGVRSLSCNVITCGSDAICEPF
jgi:hypothetical protein